MDPNETLKELLQLAHEYMETDSNDGSIDFAHGLSERILNLDEWLAKGGFLPDRWQK